MPKLAALGRDNEDLADRFLIVGVHESGVSSLSEVRSLFAATAAKLPGQHSELLPVLAIDIGPDGWTTSVDPEFLGDMVLLDPQGMVVAVGKQAADELELRLRALRTEIDRRARVLGKAESEEDVKAGLTALFDLGLAAAEREAEDYVKDCDADGAASALETIARLGRPAAVLEALEGTDTKRRAAALEAMTNAPDPAWTGPLIAFATQSRVKSKDACAALEAAVASDPSHAELEPTLSEMSQRGNTSVRVCAIVLLGRLRTASAKAVLLEILDRDRIPAARRAAIDALVEVGGDEVVEALRRAATDDRTESVRERASEALSELEGR